MGMAQQAQQQQQQQAVAQQEYQDQRQLAQQEYQDQRQPQGQKERLAAARAAVGQAQTHAQAQPQVMQGGLHSAEDTGGEVVVRQAEEDVGGMGSERRSSV